MAKLILLRDGSGPRVWFEGDADASNFVPKFFALGDASGLAFRISAAAAQAISLANLVLQGEDFTVSVTASFDWHQAFALQAGDQDNFFGWVHFQGAAQAAFTVDLSCGSAKPFLLVQAKGSASASMQPAGQQGLGIFGALASIELDFQIDQFGVGSPSFQIALNPASGFQLPSITLPKFSPSQFDILLRQLPAVNVTFPQLPFGVTWDSVEISFTGTTWTKIQIDNLRVFPRAFPQFGISGRLILGARASGAPLNCTYEVEGISPPFSVKGLTINPKAVFVEASGPIGEVPGVSALVSGAASVDFVLRYLRAERELRVDIPIDFTQPLPTLLGIPYSHAVVPQFVTIATNLSSKRIFAALTMQAGAMGNFSLPFSFSDSEVAWYPQDDQPAHKPVTPLTVTVLANNNASLVLLDSDASPSLSLRQISESHTLKKLDFNSQDESVIPRSDPFDLKQFNVLLEIDESDLPLLQVLDSNYSQLIHLKPQQAGQSISLIKQQTPIQLVLEFSLGPPGSSKMELQGEIDFDVSSLAFTGNGIITFATDQPKYEFNLFGFKLDLYGAEVSATLYNYLEFHYDNRNFRFLMAAGVRFEMSYGTFTPPENPLPFDVTYFAITKNGIDLDARVRPVPVPLNGIGTRFTFDGSFIQFRQNSIADFTLTGTGVLPPELVGDSSVIIHLQLGNRNGNVQLLSGGAQLKSTKLLSCKQTRFEFTVHALGLAFVVDNGSYHLYFTVSATAKFKLLSGEHVDGPLALLPTITLELVQCPLARDATVLAQHIEFLIQMPEPKKFHFLGCFEMELRAIGFMPKVPACGNGPAMLISGQLMFADGGGDIIDAHIDFHKLFIGLPRPGEVFPQISFTDIAVGLSIGDVFGIHGMVDYVDEPNLTGLEGSGTLQIQGLPSFTVTFGFLRVRYESGGGYQWLRAWFFYVEMGDFAFGIPVIEIYIREIGLGFGYRYTLASIAAADRAQNDRDLVKALDGLSRTQNDLSSISSWAPDPMPDALYTVALRALFSETSLSEGPYAPASLEQGLACIFLFDIVLAIRTDFTFFMSGRVYFNTNYYDFKNDNDLRANPFLTAYLYLSPRKKTLLARMMKLPGGKIGNSPPLPDFIHDALENCEFSVSLLITPVVFQYEMGWPNLLRWHGDFGPLSAECSGGFLFRITPQELVTGISFQARASLTIGGEIDLGFIGARASAFVSVAYGGRLVGFLEFTNPLGSMIYAAIGLEIRARFSIEVWLHIDVGFFSIDFDISFSLDICVTAGVELVTTSLLPGVCGNGTLEISAFGHGIRIAIHIGLNEGLVDSARSKCQSVMQLGLEASEPDPIPGIPSATPQAALAPHPSAFVMSRAATFTGIPAGVAKASLIESIAVQSQLTAPDYSAFVIPVDANSGYFVLYPKGVDNEITDAETNKTPDPQGFLPFPGNTGSSFSLTVPASSTTYIRLSVPSLLQPVQKDTIPAAGGSPAWTANWNDNYYAFKQTPATNPRNRQPNLLLAVQQGFLQDGDSFRDPIPLFSKPVQDLRVRHATDTDLDAAVKQCTTGPNSPFFRFDANNDYDCSLNKAFQRSDAPFNPDGSNKPTAPSQQVFDEGVRQMRGMVIHNIIGGFQNFVAAVLNDKNHDEQAAFDTLTGTSRTAFMLGLVFKYEGGTPQWLTQDEGGASDAWHIQQAIDATGTLSEKKAVIAFNPPDFDFATVTGAPAFTDVVVRANSHTVAIDWEIGFSGDRAFKADHYVKQYEVTRRSIDDEKLPTTFLVKNGDAVDPLNVNDSSTTKIKGRFNFVDHFEEDGLDDIALIPATGYRYIYTITAVDWNDNRGLYPLTVSAIRPPSEPPLAPVNPVLNVTYKLASPPGNSPLPPSSQAPNYQPIDEVEVTWTPPSERKNGPSVNAESVTLVFRKITDLPQGSYGFNAELDPAKDAIKPASNAAQLPTDFSINIPLDANHVKVNEFGENVATVDISGLAINGEWRSEGWVAFLQANGVNGVPSVLTPAKLSLTFIRDADPNNQEARTVVRREVGHLEFLANPLDHRVLPAVDCKAETGLLQVPISQDGQFKSGLATVEFQEHPKRLQAFGFTWNATPSDIKEWQGSGNWHPSLFAGYRIWELDALAHAQYVYDDATQIAANLRQLQEVLVVPQDQLVSLPADNRATSQWEGWYPSQVQRQNIIDAKNNARLEQGWFSWRDSHLEWPRPVAGQGVGLHNFLQAIVDQLRELDGATKPSYPRGYNVRRVNIVSSSDTTLAGFLADTGTADPYGWAALSRLGLCVGFHLFDRITGEALTGDNLITHIQASINAVLGTGNWNDYKSHLFVELMVQPGRALMVESPFSPNAKLASAGLLSFVQLSLRPKVAQDYSYFIVTVDNDRSGSVILKSDSSNHALDWAVPVAATDTSSGTGDTNSQTGTLAPGGQVRFDFPGDQQLVFYCRQQSGTTPLLTRSGTGSIKASPYDIFGTYTGLFESIAPVAQSPQPPLLAAAVPGWDGFLNVAGANVVGPGVDLSKSLFDLSLAAAYQNWSQRFFAAGPEVSIDESPVKDPDIGWTAVCYPRVSAPAYACPDFDQRLLHVHVRQDDWETAYRYYIQSIGRYDSLWASVYKMLFSSSPNADDPLAADQSPPPKPEYIKTDEGIDIVSRRIAPLKKPVAMRLAPVVKPGGESTSTLELIVARHEEEILAESNQMVRRKLGFRSVAIVPVRQPAYPSLVRLLSPTATIVPPAGKIPANLISNDLTDTPPQQGGPDDPRLNFSDRISPYNEGVHIFQVENVPQHYRTGFFIYAMADSVASDAVDVFTQDMQFSLRQVDARIGVAIDANNAICILLNIVLPIFWDTLPDQVQKQWQGELPAGTASTISPSGLPDPQISFELYEKATANPILLGDFRYPADFVQDPTQQPPGGPLENKSLQVLWHSAQWNPVPKPIEANQISNNNSPWRFTQPISLTTLSDERMANVTGWFTKAAALSGVTPVVGNTLAWVGNAVDPFLLATKLKELAGDPSLYDGLRNALLQLAGSIAFSSSSWRTTFQFAAALNEAEVPTSLKDRVTTKTDPHDPFLVTSLSWSGAVFDEDHPAIAAWCTNVGQLLGPLKALVRERSSVGPIPLPPPAGTLPRPTQDELNHPFSGALVYGASNASIQWHGQLITKAQLPLLIGMAGQALEPGFIEALKTLISKLTEQQVINVSYRKWFVPVSASSESPVTPVLGGMLFESTTGLNRGVPLPDKDATTLLMSLGASDPQSLDHLNCQAFYEALLEIPELRGKSFLIRSVRQHDAGPATPIFAENVHA